MKQHAAPVLRIGIALVVLATGAMQLPAPGDADAGFLPRAEEALGLR